VVACVAEFGNIRWAGSYSDALTAVPEPSTYALIFGFLTLGAVFYRRRRLNR